MGAFHTNPNLIWHVVVTGGALLYAWSCNPMEGDPSDDGVSPKDMDGMPDGKMPFDKGPRDAYVDIPSPDQDLDAIVDGGPPPDMRDMMRDVPSPDVVVDIPDMLPVDAADMTLDQSLDMTPDSGDMTLDMSVDRGVDEGVDMTPDVSVDMSIPPVCDGDGDTFVTNAVMGDVMLRQACRAMGFNFDIQRPELLDCDDEDPNIAPGPQALNGRIDNNCDPEDDFSLDSFDDAQAVWIEENARIADRGNAIKFDLDDINGDDEIDAVIGVPNFYLDAANFSSGAAYIVLGSEAPHIGAMSLEHAHVKFYSDLLRWGCGGDIFTAKLDEDDLPEIIITCNRTNPNESFFLIAYGRNGSGELNPTYNRDLGGWEREYYLPVISQDREELDANGIGLVNGRIGNIVPLGDFDDFGTLKIASVGEEGGTMFIFALENYTGNEINLSDLRQQQGAYDVFAGPNDIGYARAGHFNEDDTIDLMFAEPDTPVDNSRGEIRFLFGGPEFLELDRVNADQEWPKAIVLGRFGPNGYIDLSGVTAEGFPVHNITLAGVRPVETLGDNPTLSEIAEDGSQKLAFVGGHGQLLYIFENSRAIGQLYQQFGNGSRLELANIPENDLTDLGVRIIDIPETSIVRDNLAFSKDQIVACPSTIGGYICLTSSTGEETHGNQLLDIAIQTINGGETSEFGYNIKSKGQTILIGRRRTTEEELIERDIELPTLARQQNPDGDRYYQTYHFFKNKSDE